KIRVPDKFPKLDNSWHLPYRDARGVEVRRFIDIDRSFDLNRIQLHPALNDQREEAAERVESRAARVSSVVKNSRRQEIESRRHHRSLTVAEPQDQAIFRYIGEKWLGLAAPSGDGQHASQFFLAAILDFTARLINKTRQFHLWNYGVHGRRDKPSWFQHVAQRQHRFHRVGGVANDEMDRRRNLERHFARNPRRLGVDYRNNRGCSRLDQRTPLPQEHRLAAQLDERLGNIVARRVAQPLAAAGGNNRTLQSLHH